MASTTETGHAKNIANLKSLNEINAGFGAEYAPSNPLLVLATMVGQHTTCAGLQSTVNTQTGVYQPIENARMIEFKDVKPLVRRVRIAAKSSGASKEFYTDVNEIVNKILGERSSKPNPTETDPAGTSASQQSYDNTVNNMDALVQMLIGEPLYNPSKADLKTAALTTKQTNMNKKNNDVKTAVVPYNNAVIARNKALYKTTIGLCDVGQNSKNEVRSIFGYSSPEFKQVSKLKFTKLAKVD